LHFSSAHSNLALSQIRMPTETKPDAKPEGKHDPFKPKTPAIPGVPAEDPNRKKAAPPSPQAPIAAATRPTPPPAPRSIAPGDDDSKQRMIAIAAVLVSCLILGGLFLVPTLMSPAKPATSPAPSAASAPNADSELSAAAALTGTGPIAPGVIATTEELAKPWSSKAFSFRDQISGRLTPALVVRIPNGGYWGFSMLEPYGTCKLEFVTDLAKLRDQYDFTADHPMLVDPCQHAVFDLLQYSGASDSEVRGAVVHGVGVRPPLAIEIEQHGKDISAVKME
jgi:hypothetical protein